MQRMIRLPYQVETLSLSTKNTMLENNVNAYLIVADGKALLIDAGFPESALEISQHIINAKLQLEGIYLTHFHPDHSLGALQIAKSFQVKIHCHPHDLAPLISLYEQHFPLTYTDEVIADLIDGLKIPFAEALFNVLHIPGHTHGHIAIFDKTYGNLFIGDHVIPDGTVWIGPPDGHLCDYLDSLDRLLLLPATMLYPGHGAPLSTPQALMARIKQRRLDREADILAYLRVEEVTLATLVDRIYRGKIPTEILWAAKKTVTAHLQKLLFDQQITMRFAPSEHQFYYTEAVINSHLTGAGND